MLRLELLGGLRVYVDDRLVIGPHTPGLKAKALLAYLYLKRSRYVPREELLEALWPESDHPRSGRLKQTVLVLRRLIEPGRSRGDAGSYVLQRGGTYYFNNQANYTADVEEFARELALARASGEVQHYQRAIGVGRGELLPELRYESWVSAAAAQHRAEYVSALDVTAGLLALRGDLCSAIELLECAVEEDPLRESTSLELMRLLRQAGRDVEALCVYERLQRLLGARLQVAPNGDLTRLYDAIRRARETGVTGD
jgi:DNA-binding SARP family transcriptional activator